MNESKTSSAVAHDARAVAAAITGEVLRRGQTLEKAFLDEPRFSNLEKRDAAYARLLTMTTLRRLGQIDAFLAHLMVHPLPRQHAAVQDLLRLGVCQLAFLGTPAHAAVDRMVRLATGNRLQRYRGLINAILRRAAREIGAVSDMDAAHLNTPTWLWSSWERAYGIDTCRAIAQRHLFQAPLDVTVPQDQEAWAARLGAKRLQTGSLRLYHSGLISTLPGYKEGGWWVQDAAAALPARLLGHLSGQTVVEIGAAPGGKTAQLATIGAHVTAVDRSARRITRLRENLARLKLTAEVVEADALNWRPRTLADAVLLDTPCSATGTIRRHPDIPHLRTADDVEQLTKSQRRLLHRVSSIIKPGGLLVYVSCSLQPEECECRINEFLSNTPKFERVPVRMSEIGNLAGAITEVGDLRTLPCHLDANGGMDGFYAARLRLRE